MKNYKHTFFAYFLIALFVALSLSDVFKSGAVYSSIPEPEFPGLFYSMQMPFIPGTAVSDRVEQIILDQNNHHSKSLDELKYSYSQDLKSIRKHLQYTNLYNKRPIKSICDFNCVIQI